MSTLVPKLNVAVFDVTVESNAEAERIAEASSAQITSLPLDVGVPITVEGSVISTVIADPVAVVASFTIIEYVPAARSVGIAPNAPPSTEYSNGAVPQFTVPSVNEPSVPPLHVTLTGLNDTFTASVTIFTVAVDEHVLAAVTVTAIHDHYQQLHR